MLYFILLSLVLGTYFAYYYLYRHRAQQTCRVACDCEAINLKNNVQPTPISGKMHRCLSLWFLKMWECNQGLRIGGEVN